MQIHQPTIGRVALFCAVLAVVLAAPALVREASADSAKDRARTHYVKGKGLFDKGEYKAAIAEFAAADALAPAPLLEFNIALCHEKLGDSKEAVRRYRVYIDRDPNAANRSEVEDKIRRMQADLDVGAERQRAEEEARRAEEERLKAEAAAKKPTGPAEAAPPADRPAPPASPRTGDPELDRAAAVDIAAIRDQRGGGGGGSAEAAPPPTGRQGGATASNQGPPPVRDQPKSKPVYKQWWFWVVVGVSAIILIDIATSDSNDSTALELPDASGLGNTRVGAPVLLRF